ncbi:MAG: EthD domain-containing protein [Novosphingobium sp.]|nr:EthD domain-containing protein [Novosphingobium sp.]
MHKLMIFMKRRPGMSHAEFRSYYEDHHVPLCMPCMAGPRRYVRHFIEPGPDGQDGPFDVITELWFDSARMRDAVLQGLRSDAMPADVIADEEKLFDRSAARAFAISDCETVLEARAEATAGG